jgi:hypothetical protein
MSLTQGLDLILNSLRHEKGCGSHLSVTMRSVDSMTLWMGGGGAKGQGWSKMTDQCCWRFHRNAGGFIGIQSKRDSLKQEEAYKQVVFCAFGLVPRAVCATFIGMLEDL